ncbi:MAG TPA: NAD(P)/FAD-dependent oxidoreductase [Terriglobales bacterium]|nr:NAD(P)/FAD-dependent oxidoreductase [Terriglobales bacterium]
MKGTANVIGAGPNGLAAGIVLAQAGFKVEVFEAEPQPGGAARTLPLTMPGFLHDFGSAVYPMAVGSPFFTSLHLSEYGLQWIHPGAPLAHPLDDGTAVILERSVDATAANLGQDGRAWRKLFAPLADHWFEMAPDLLSPVTRIPSHPWLMAKMGLRGFPPATWVAKGCFRGERAKALFAGLAAHSFLSLDEPLSAAFGLILGATAHAVGWPIPRGGAQCITNSLCAHLEKLGGKITTATRVARLADLPKADLNICDITPRQLLRLASERLSERYRRQLRRWRYGPGAFKVDFALSEPIPWRASDCWRAATVHLGGTLEEISASEKTVWNGQPAERPFVLLAQPSLFDETRAPAGRHTAWAYCHVPNGSTFDMLPRLEAQIERFAPGFRDCVLARHVLSPAGLESMDRNLVGGDINGGAADLWQFLARPTFRHYATSAPDIFLCSASTPPGGGVHGMCGFNAAMCGLKSIRRR